ALVGSAVQEGQRLIVVMNGLKSATDRAEEARKFFNYGFHSFDRRTVFEARGEADKLVAKIVYVGPLTAPIEKGKDAGRLKIWRDDMLVIDAPLKTGDAVALGGLTGRAFDAGVELAGDAARRAWAGVLAHTGMLAHK